MKILPKKCISVYKNIPFLRASKHTEKLVKGIKLTQTKTVLTKALKIFSTKKLFPFAIGAIFILIPALYLVLKNPKPIYAAPWAQPAGEWGMRKQITLTNNSGATLNTGATFSISVDTKSLYDAGYLKSDCSDLRVYYQPSDTTTTELYRHTVPASGTTCATSTSTKVSFSLQASMSNAASNTSYYVYYGNRNATTYSDADALKAYNVGAKQATFVASFNGTTQALAAGSGTPTTATGAIRYSQGKSVLSFDGSGDDKVAVSDIGNIWTGDFTEETWIKLPPQWAGTNNQDILTHSNALIDVYYDSPTTQVLWFYVGSSGRAVDFRARVTIAANTWHHVAAVFYPSTQSARMFLDGTEVTYITQTTGQGNLPTTFPVTVGNRTTAYFNGLIDEVRVSNTVRYSANFTPSISPFVRDEYTKLLLHFDENGDDPRNTGKAIDDSGNGNHGTITGAKYVDGLVGVDNSTTTTGYQANQSYASHNGVFIEEGTTNKITNPSFEHSTYNTNWTGPTSFNYSSSADTFTAGMAKRNSAGPFAAGFLSQGVPYTGTTVGDVITNPANNTISGRFYEQFDNNQGSFVFWITPEWNGNDNLQHYIWQNPNATAIYKNTSNQLVFDAGFGFSYGTSISSWVAGTTYQVVVRWDQDGKIDGTNYICVSVNDSHSCGMASPASNFNWDDNFYIGGSREQTYPANAIIEGFTIYRRVLFDGTYGIDAGNGDEINQIYNSGTGKDPTLITGSWDVVFALPTNASTGALTTGTGNAWSHPHASNLLYTSTTNTGGFMMNGTYGTDGFSLVGSPANTQALATAEKIFTGGYKYTSADANQGIYRTFTATSGGDYVLRALGHSDGTCNPQIKITRADGTTEISHLNGTTTSTRTAPNVYIFTWESPAAESEQVQLINTASSGTCYWHQVEVLTNSVNNPSLEGGSGDPFIPTGWSSTYLVAGDTAEESGVLHSGSKSVKFNSSAVGYHTLKQSISSTVGKFYAMGGWLASTASTPIIYTFDDGGTYAYLQNTASTRLQLTSTSSPTIFEHKVGVVRTNNDPFRYILMGNTNVGYVDDTYSFPLTDVSLTVTPATEANSLETSGLRVDGTDTLTQPITNITTTAGTLKFKFTPRHSLGVNGNFGWPAGVNGAVIFAAYADMNNQIQIYQSNTTQITLYGKFNNTAVTAVWDSATLNAGTTYNFEISYASGGSLALKVDGTTVATQTGVVNFATAPTTAYFGCWVLGTNQYDAAFAYAFPDAPTATENTTAPYFKFGSKSAKLVATGDSRYITSINPGNTNTHTLSAYVYNGTSGAVGGTVDTTVAKLIFNGSAVTPTYSDMGGGWWRLYYNGTPPSGASDYGIGVLAGKTVYIDGVQIEEKTYRTTYADGSLGTGYSWSGTASESTSTRTLGTLKYAANNNATPSSGSLSLWFKPYSYLFSNSAEVKIFSIGGTSRGSVNLNYGDGNFAPNLRVTNNAGDVGYITTKDTIHNNDFVMGKWYQFTIAWNTNDVRLYLNGNSVGTPVTTFSSLSSFVTDAIQIGGPNPPIADTYSDFRIFNTALSSAEVSDLYYSGLGSHSEQAVASERYTDGDQPVLVWHFDEGTGTTAYDSSLSRDNGTISGATWDSDSSKGGDALGKSLKFNGTSNYVSRTYANDSELNPSTNSFSVSAWFKAPSAAPASQKTLIARYNQAGYKLYMKTTGVVCFGLDDDSTWGPDDEVCTTATYNDSNWHHIEAVRGATTATIFMDGKQATQINTTVTGSLSGNASAFITGIDTDLSSNAWNGFIDEVRVYNSNKTSEQVQQEYISKGANKGVDANFGSTNTLSSGLVGYWKMDEASGTLTDSSGNGNTGTWNGTGANHFTTGNFGNGNGYNGTDDYVSLANNSGLNSNVWSYSGWVKWLGSDGGGFGGLFQGAGGAGTMKNRLLITSGTGAVGFQYASGTWNLSGSAISQNQWYHLALTMDSAGIPRLYINGTLDKTGTAGTLYSGSNPVLLGLGAGSTYYFKGYQDEVRFYNRTLSASEVQQLYNYAPGPVAWWKMDDATGQTVTDSSGNGNNGTLGADSSVASDDPTWAVGKYGRALKFDGVNDYAKGTRSSSIANNYTIEAWVKTATGTTNSDRFAVMGGTNCGNNIELMIRPKTENISDPQYLELGRCIGFNGTSSTVAVPVNVWTHVAVTVNSSNSAVYYVNGTFAGTSSPSDPTIAATFTVGTNITPRKFNGLIDDFRIYNYARTQKQILQDMNASAGGLNGNKLSPVAYYKFDEGQGVTAGNLGIGGSALNGTLTNMANPATATSGWTNSGKFGKGLVFDGSDDYVNLGSSPTLNPSTGLTISAWVKPTTGGGSSGYMVLGRTNGSTDSYQLRIDSSNRAVNAYLWNTGGTLYSKITQNNSIYFDQWNHIVMTFDSTTNRLDTYINGVVSGVSTTTAGTLRQSAITTYIGNWHTGTAYLYKGSMDEMKVYNYALSSDEIREDYNRGVTSKAGSLSTTSAGVTDNSNAAIYCVPGSGDTCTAPVGEWKMDEKSGSLVKDTSGNNRNGAAIASTLTINHVASGGVAPVDKTVTYGLVTTDIGGTGNKTWIVQNLGADHPAASVTDSTEPSAGWYWQFNRKQGYKYDSSRTPNTTWETPISENLDWQAANDPCTLELGSAWRLPTYTELYNMDNTGGWVDYNGPWGSALKMHAGGYLTAAAGAINMRGSYGYIFASTQQSVTTGWSFVYYNAYSQMNPAILKANGFPLRCVNDSVAGIPNVWTTGKNSGALNFNGTNQHAYVGSGPSSVKTISFWVYPKTTTEYFMNLTGTSAYIWSNAGTVTATGLTSPAIYVNGVQSSTIVANKWQHITVTTSTAVNASNLDFGRTQDTNYLEGKLDQVLMYDYVRTPSQVALDFSKGEPLTWYKFNDCKGSIAYDSATDGGGASRGNNLSIYPASSDNTSVGTCNSGVSTEMWNDGTTGRIGASLGLDGTDDYAATGNVALLASNSSTYTNVSWGGWFRGQSNASKTLVHKDTEFKLTTTANGYPSCQIYSGSWQTGASYSGAIPTGSWVHLVCTYDGANIKLYVNGVLKATQPQTGAITSSSSTALNVGRDSAGSGYFNGKVDEVKIYNYALTPAQVKSFYNSGAVNFGSGSNLTCAPFTVNHLASGGVAPVDKTVTYGVVKTNIAGTGNKC